MSREEQVFLQGFSSDIKAAWMGMDGKTRDRIYRSIQNYYERMYCTNTSTPFKTSDITACHKLLSADPDSRSARAVRHIIRSKGLDESAFQKSRKS